MYYSICKLENLLWRSGDDVMIFTSARQSALHLATPQLQTVRMGFCLSQCLREGLYIRFKLRRRNVAVGATAQIIDIWTHPFGCKTDPIIHQHKLYCTSQRHNPKTSEITTYTVKPPSNLKFFAT